MTDAKDIAKAAEKVDKAQADLDAASADLAKKRNEAMQGGDSMGGGARPGTTAATVAGLPRSMAYQLSDPADIRRTTELMTLNEQAEVTESQSIVAKTGITMHDQDPEAQAVVERMIGFTGKPA